LSVYEAGAGVLDIVNTQMNDLLRTMIASKGYDTHDFTLLYYGGAGPVHMYGFAEGIEFADVITMPWAAGFSAFGAACSEYMHRYSRGLRVLIPNGLTDTARTQVAQQVRSAWAELEREALDEMTLEGVDPAQVTFRYGIAARYIGQLESFDTSLPDGTMANADDVHRMIDAFEMMYTKVYPDGARFPDAGYSITAVHLEAIAPKPQPLLAEYPLSAASPSKSALVGTRNVYHGGVWTSFNVYEMAELKAGNVVKGPAIIRDPMTTVVIPPKRSMRFDKYRILHYR
jgi:acetone carboxylase, beta subunit